jgi:arylsulfatase A-like enzyme
VTTVAERLRGLGYRTSALVANYGAVGRSAGFDRGFDSFVELHGDPYARAATVRTAAERWLETRASDRPYFLYLHFLDPHRPYLAGDDTRSRRPAAALPGYRAELRQLDSVLSDLLARLSATSRERTWLLLTSDHGEEFGEHGEEGHGHSLYDELLQIPLILHGKGSPAQAIDTPLEGRDIFDLLLSIASPDFAAQRWAETRRKDQRYASLRLTTSMAPWRPSRRFVAARRLTDENSAVIWSALGNTIELYDRKSDPNESFNLAGLDSKRLREASEQLRRQMPEALAPGPFDETEGALAQLRALGYVE